jgi:hypothetical protein
LKTRFQSVYDLLEALYEFVVLFFKLAGFQSKQPFYQIQKGAPLGSRTPCHAHEMEIIQTRATFDDPDSSPVVRSLEPEVRQYQKMRGFLRGLLRA